MANAPNRGDKFSCVECNTRFFDMHKTPPTCPKCGKRVVIVPKVLRLRGRIAKAAQ